MKKILFITATRIGDAVLSMGLLNHMVTHWPDCKITVACGPLVTGFFDGVPQVERVITLKKEKRAGHWRKLWRQVAFTRWDMVVDLRNSFVSRAVLAKEKFIFGPHIDGQRHKVEQNAAVMKLAYTPDPKLWFTPSILAEAKMLVPDGTPVLGVGPAANWFAKTWPADRFIALLKILTGEGGILPGARIAVIAAPGEEAQALPVLESIPPHQRIDLIGKTSPHLAAACIARCSFFVGNDSGLTHSAAAAGVPTLGLFGPSWPHIYRPWGAWAGFVATPQNFAELTAYPGYDSKTAPCLMEELSVDRVAAAAHDVWGRLQAGKTRVA